MARIEIDEPLLDHVPRLQRAVRFWRATSLILAAILLSTLGTGLFFFVAVHRRTLLTMEAVMHHERAVRQEMEAVMHHERAARHEAEAARVQVERALKAAKEAKKE